MAEQITVTHFTCIDFIQSRVFVLWGGVVGVISLPHNHSNINTLLKYHSLSNPRKLSANVKPDTCRLKGEVEIDAAKCNSSVQMSVSGVWDV